jgi:DNA-directed RNA polymerase sigma subunit (sigma70/sigma32)
MGDEKADWTEAIRSEVHSLLAALTPQEAKALRARFGIDDANRVADDEEGTLRALARELTMLKKKRRE